MGRRIREHDWPGSPLGDPLQWPPALKTLVGVMLASRQPMFMAWGDAQTWLYNDAFIPILGSKHPAALGRPALAEVWSEAREALSPLFARVFAGEPVHMDDFGLMLDRDGRLEEAHFAFSYTPVRDEGGIVTGLFGACIETTDRILANRREVAAMERQRQMFEQAPSFMCMLGGPRHVFEFVNKAHRDLFRSEGWIGRPVREAFPDLGGQGFYEALDEVYRTGKRYLAEAAVVQFSRVPGGPVEERLLNFVYEPVLDAAGAVTGIFCEGVDVTEANLTQQALRENEAQLRFLDDLGMAIRDATDPGLIRGLTARLLGEHLGAGGCAYAEVDSERGTCTVRNDWTRGGAPIAGVHPCDALPAAATATLCAGRPLVVHDAGAELPSGGGTGLLQRAGARAAVCYPHSHAGRVVAAMAVYQSAPRRWSEREVALIGAVVERTWQQLERIEAQEKFREADRRKDVFLATLAHELRNPLAPLRNALHLLRQNSVSRSDSIRPDMLLGMMERQVDQLVRLVDDLLDVARITQGKIDLQLAPVEIMAIVHHAVETTAFTVKQAGRRIEVSPPPARMYVKGDAQRLVQVLCNLINNAVKFSDPAGIIQVAVAQDGDEIVVAVKDRGVGIPADKLEEVFEMFSQLDHSLDRSKTGLGLGLPLARQILQLHAGTIAAASAGPGLGSEFTVRLPLLPFADVAHDVSGAAHAAARGKRILVADDNRDSADSIGMLLSAAGHTVEVVYDGFAALGAANRLQPDVLLLDIGMPRMNGYDVAREVRQQAWSTHAVIIALTGWGQDEDRMRSRDAGIDHHLVKPVEFAALAKAVSGQHQAAGPAARR